MSKPIKPIFLAAAVILQILHFLNISNAQSAEITVEIGVSKATITGIIKDNGGAAKVTSFSLPDQVAGTKGLLSRISALELLDGSGKLAASKTLAPGEILVPEGFTAFRFNADLRPLSMASMAHASWFDGTRGIVFGPDLIPKFDRRIPVTLDLRLPAGVRAAFGAGFPMPIDDRESAVFFLGSGFREPPAASARIVVDGEFLFSDQDAAKFADEIISAYGKIFGSGPNGAPRIVICRYPAGTPWGRWEAETRGSTVVIMSADMPFSTPSVQRLHEQLRHEFFHLWMPNSMALDGDYDWFYEGFALYQSLRTAVWLNRIRFEDFLDTLGRAYDADSMLSVRRSLIESSRDRWSGANTHIYARGMLVGFMADLAMINASKGKRSVNDLLTAVWRKHRTGNPRVNGNDAILKEFALFPELSTIVSRYVSGSEPIEWRTELAFAGIEFRSENFSSKLVVMAKPNGRQRELLDKLGYNNWRNYLKKVQ